MPRGSKGKRGKLESCRVRRGIKIELYVRRKQTTCGICYKHMLWDDISIDHIVSLSNGGTNDIKNLQLTHIKCNNKKGNNDDRSSLP